MQVVVQKRMRVLFGLRNYNTRKKLHKKAYQTASFVCRFSERVLGVRLVIPITRLIPTKYSTCTCAVYVGILKQFLDLFVIILQYRPA